MLPSSMASMVPVSSSSRILQCRRAPVPVFHDTPDVGAMAEPLEPRVALCRPASKETTSAVTCFPVLVLLWKAN